MEPHLVVVVLEVLMYPVPLQPLVQQTQAGVVAVVEMLVVQPAVPV
jgi:hypothetical protein